MRRSAGHRLSRAVRRSFGSRAAARAWQKSTRQQIRGWPPSPGIPSRRESYRFGLRQRSGGKQIADLQPIRSVLFPFVQGQAVRFEQLSDLTGSPMSQLVKYRHHDAKVTIAEDHAFGDPRELLVLGDCEGKSMGVVR